MQNSVFMKETNHYVSTVLLPSLQSYTLEDGTSHKQEGKENDDDVIFTKEICSCAYKFYNKSENVCKLRELCAKEYSILRFFYYE